MRVPASVKHQSFQILAWECLPALGRTSRQQSVWRDAWQSLDSAGGEGGEQDDSNETKAIPPERERATSFLCYCLVDVQTTGKALPAHEVLETLPWRMQGHVGNETRLSNQGETPPARAACHGVRWCSWSRCRGEILLRFLSGCPSFH